MLRCSYTQAVDIIVAVAALRLVAGILLTSNICRQGMSDGITLVLRTTEQKQL